MDGDGYFYLVDRKKDMIISGGFNVYPQMIEQAIYTHPAVQEVIVIGIPDDYRGEAAKAFIKLRAAPSRSRWTNCAPSSPASSASTKFRRRSISSMNCRAPRSASCRATNCASSSRPQPKQQQLAIGRPCVTCGATTPPSSLRRQGPDTP